MYINYSAGYLANSVSVATLNCTVPVLRAGRGFLLLLCPPLGAPPHHVPHLEHAERRSQPINSELSFSFPCPCATTETQFTTT